MSRTAVGLGIDAGASSSRWLLLAAEGQVLGRGSGEAVTGHIFSAQQQAQTFARLRALLREAQAAASPYGPVAVVAGITGLESDEQKNSAEAERFRELIAGELALPLTRVAVVNDMVIAYRAALAPGEGVLLYAGTGSVAYHLTAAGKALRAGGWGYLIDDAGAGFWIGQQALRWLLREVDAHGRPAAGELAERLYGALGHRDWPGIRSVIYGEGRERVAALAPAVGSAAAAGDAVAMQILAAAGGELARLASALLGRLGGIPGGLPVAFAGGVRALGAPLLEALQRGLPGGAELRLPDREPVLAAAEMALALAADG